MACWSPLDAMNAYVRTLQLCKEYCNNTTDKLLEPECIEFISALAAGNRAQRMVAVTSDGLSPSTLALAIAARCTGGRLVCVCHDRETLNQIRTRIEESELGDVVSFKVGADPCEVMKQYKNIDFAVVDHRIRNCEAVLSDIDMNPNGSMVVLSNLFSGPQRKVRASYLHTRKCRKGIESSVLPVGGGMEVTRIQKNSSSSSSSRGSKRRTSKRTFLVYEE